MSALHVALLRGELGQPAENRKTNLRAELTSFVGKDADVAAVRERDALLILDNCEHVIGPAAMFAHRVLGECPRLRILATSREPFGITGEALWLVEPRALPEGDARPDEIESSPAVQLPQHRASAVRRDLVVDARALATMAHVCRALDGLPLAIELAAARLRTMSVGQLVARQVAAMMPIAASQSSRLADGRKPSARRPPR